jgi:MATE family multidrug resistance protein
MSELVLPEKSHAPGSIRELLAVAVPMVVSSACDTTMIFTDRLFLSRLGSEQMNAAMAGGLTSFVMMTFFIGLAGYSTALVAQYLGAGRKERCARVTTQALLVCLAAYPLILLCRPLGPWMFRLSGIDQSQLAPQIVYFNVLLYASVVALARHCLSCFFSGIGKTRVVMISALTAMTVNIAANYVLIFGKLGFAPLGILGAAYGTILGSLCGLAVVAGAYLSKANRAAYGVGESLKFDWEIMKKLLRFGYPAGLEFFFNLVAFNIMIMLFHSRGLVTATAVTILFNWDLVTFMPLLGIEVAVTSLVGRYMGASNPDTAHRACMSGLKSGWVYSALMLVLFVGFPSFMVDVFRPETGGEVFQQARPMALFMVKTVAFYIMVEAIIIVFSGALRGAGDTFWAMCISVGLHWLMLPVVFLMLNVLKLDPEYAWVFVIVIYMVFTIFFWLRYRSGKWRKLRVIGNEPPPPTLDSTHEIAGI